MSAGLTPARGGGIETGPVTGDAHHCLPRSSAPSSAENRNTECPGRMFVVTGSGCVVLGGLVAAVTGPLELAKGSWLAAYFVLVCGVAQVAFGTVQVRLAGPSIPPARAWAQLTCWNLGNAAVIWGTLTGVPVIVDAGGALLVIGLGIAFLVSRPAGPRLAGRVYRCVLVVLLLSVPIGLALAHLRHTA
jgi:hypothetical protein